MQGARALVRVLVESGVEHVFGLPGDTGMSFYEALGEERGRITHVMTRDERSASFMADAYARVSGRVGVCEGPSGGGATASARRHRSPSRTPRRLSAYHKAVTSTFPECEMADYKDKLEEWREAAPVPLDRPSPYEKVRVLDPAPDPRFNRDALTSLARLFPAFARANVVQEWAGLIDVTPDVVPVISPVEALPGFVVATGFSGHGFGIGPGAGACGGHRDRRRAWSTGTVPLLALHRRLATRTIGGI